jgi:hypothetical protein
VKTRLIKTTLAALAGVGLIGSIAACGQQVATAEVGACIVTADLPSDMTDIPTVECTEEHDAQVVGKFDVDDGDYPGDDALTAEADERCAAAFEEFVGIAYADSSLDISYVYPSEDTWTQANDREILCFAATADGSTVTESWEGAAI